MGSFRAPGLLLVLGALLLCWVVVKNKVDLARAGSESFNCNVRLELQLHTETRIVL